MRGTVSQAATIRRVVTACFGADAEVRLFGSRLRDEAYLAGPGTLKP